MHANIEKILRRANGLLIAAWLVAEATPDQRRALSAAYRKLNPGRDLARVKAMPRLPLDPDGAETLSAARLVAEAMGLRVAGHGDLDEGREIGSGHLVVLRRIEGQEDPRHAWRIERAQQAGMCIEIATQATGLGASLERRRAAASADPRQPSLF